MPIQEVAGPFSKIDLGVRAVIDNLRGHGLSIEEVAGKVVEAENSGAFGLRLPPSSIIAFRLTLKEPQPSALTWASLASNEYRDYKELMRLLRSTGWTADEKNGVERMFCQNLAGFFRAKAAGSKISTNKQAFEANVAVLTRKAASIADTGLGPNAFVRMVEPAVLRHWNFTTQAST